MELRGRRNTPTAQHHNGSTSCSRSEISGRRDADLYPLAAPRAAPTEHSTVCRATRSRRLAADVADFFLA